MLEWACFGTGVGGKLPVPAVRRGENRKKFHHSSFKYIEDGRIEGMEVYTCTLDRIMAVKKNKVNKDLKKKNNNVTYLISSSDLARNQ